MERKLEVELESRLLESSQKLQWTKCTVKAGTSRPRARENELQKPISLREAGDGMQLGDAKEGIQLGESSIRARATLAGVLQDERGHGKSEGDEEAGAERTG